jgi:hypothetical protein
LSNRAPSSRAASIPAWSAEHKDTENLANQ